MLQFSYAPETMAALVKRPTDRTEVIRKLATKLGGTLVGAWLCFGEYDGLAIIEGHDSVSAAACAMAVSASGAFSAVKTTELLTAEEGMAAMRKADGLGYKPPSGKKK